MDAERLTPPSPTRDQVIEVGRLASAHCFAYDDDRCRAIAETCLWILGEGVRPCLAPHHHIDQEAH
jgi:hypothetical protein